MAFANPLQDAISLAQRFEESEPFRRYVIQRMWLVAPAALIAAIASLACAFGTVLFIGGTRPLFVLLGLVVAPFVLIGSFFVLGYVFLSWLENRALARALRHPVGMPPVPWVLAAIFLALPLAMLAAALPTLAAAVALLLVLGPIVFARLDR